MGLSLAGLQPAGPVQAGGRAAESLPQPLLLDPPRLQRLSLHARWTALQVLPGRLLPPPHFPALLLLPGVCSPQLLPVVFPAARWVLTEQLLHLPQPPRRPLPVHEVLLHGHDAERPVALVRAGRVHGLPDRQRQPVQAAGGQHAQVYLSADARDLHRPPPQHPHADNDCASCRLRPPHELVGQGQRRHPRDLLGTILHHFSRFAPRLLANHSHLRLDEEQGVDTVAS
mmetsp:Transcript_6078/g.21457  ORF Transcript_6078/g.21457 Transcript_6078/m.21457 type:complete len:228 (-) Transcript_6078:1188-1871(-)